jgi:hypothetical protein
MYHPYNALRSLVFHGLEHCAVPVREAGCALVDFVHADQRQQRLVEARLVLLPCTS